MSHRYLPLNFLLSHTDDEVITTNSLNKNLVASVGIVLTRNVTKCQIIRQSFENRFNLPQKLEVEHNNRTILDDILHFLKDTNRSGILCPRKFQLSNHDDSICQLVVTVALNLVTSLSSSNPQQGKVNLLRLCLTLLKALSMKKHNSDGGS